MRPIHLALGLLASCAMTTLAQAAKAPADICAELVGWLDQRQAQAAGAPAPAGQPPAPQQAGQQQPPAQQEAGQPPARQRASGVEEPAPRRDLNTAVEQARSADPQKPGGQDEPQRTSGMTGPVTSAGPGAAGPQGDAQETAKSGAPNPRPDAEQSLGRSGAEACRSAKARCAGQAPRREGASARSARHRAGAPVGAGAGSSGLPGGCA